MGRPMTRWILALVCVLGLAQTANAQDYPTQPVKLVVGDAAGDAFPAGRHAFAGRRTGRIAGAGAAGASVLQQRAGRRPGGHPAALV